MAESTSSQAMTQEVSWMRRIQLRHTLQLLAGKFKHALGFGSQGSKERELLSQRDELQGRVDSLVADKHELASKIESEKSRLEDEHRKKLGEMHERFTAQINGLKAELEASSVAAKETETVSERKLASLTSRIATLGENTERLQLLRDEESKAHQDRVGSMQAELDTANTELEATQTRLRSLEVLTQDKDVAHQAHSQNFQNQLTAARESLDLFKASAEEKNIAQRAEIDAKAQQVVDLQVRQNEMQSQLNSKDDMLRSTLKDLKGRHVESEDEQVRSIIARIESGLPQLTYPTQTENRLQGPVRKSYKYRMRQMQAARQRLLQDSKKQPEPTGFDTEPDTGLDESKGSVQSANRDEGDDRILEYVLSSMKVALPRSIAGQTAVAFPDSDDEYQSQDDMSDASSSDESHTQQHTQQHKSPKKIKFSSKAIQPNAEEVKRREFYSEWPRRIYTSEPLDQNTIRLVDILAGSGNEPLKLLVATKEIKDASGHYEALSYVCGEQERGHRISLNGNKVEVYPNLHIALRWLRRPNSTRRMWIDAISINQRSKTEKSKEIQRMGPIYNQAKTVSIFLGAPSPSKVDSIHAFIKMVNRGLDGNAIRGQSHRGLESLESLCHTCEVTVPEVCQGLVGLCQQEWWRRIWTMEFYLAANEPVFYWGDECCNLGALKQGFELMESSFPDIHTLILASQRGIPDLNRDLPPSKTSISAEMRRISRYISRCYRNDDFDIPRRVYSELVAKASDPHDYIYGLRAMFDPVFGKVFVPDYRMSPEILFACLAVYLVMVEGWVDLLWWYPTRYNARDSLASWWPDFSLRSMPHEFDVKPFDLDLNKEPELTITVQNHLLYADGYVLDEVYAHRHVDKSDGHKIFSELWQFDHCMNWNHECNEYSDQVSEADNEWIRAFWDMHRDRYAELTHFNSSFRGSLLRSTINVENKHKLPRQVAQCVPCWDVLLWHALRIAPPEIPEAFGQDTKPDEPGCLEDIFSSRMRDIFLEAFADFFIGACIFDWGHFSVWLRRFPTASQWSPSNHQYWASTTASPSKDTRQRSRVIVAAYNGYVNEIQSEIMRNSWCYSFYYVFLAYVILLDCDDYETLANTITQLQKAAEKLRQVYSSSTIQQIQDLAPQVPELAVRLSCYETVLELFRGRYLLWTWGGFRGISCPGVEIGPSENSIVVIADGLSFPVVVNDFNDETGEGRLTGCVLLRGVDMLDRDTETAYLPPDYVLGEKRRFKLK